MAENKIHNLRERVKKGPINSNWFNNVAKSMGFLSADLAKELMPNTADFMSQNASDTMRMVQDMRKNISSRNMVGRQLKQIPQIEMGKNMLRNTLEDIKSGNIYNSERKYSQDKFDEDEDMMTELFGEDMGIEFLDDDEDSMFVDESDSVTINKNNTVKNVIDMMPLSNVVASGTQATVQALDAVNEQNRAFATEKMMVDNRILNTVAGGLESINENMSTLVQFHSDSTTKYYAASIKFYEDFLASFEEKVSANKMPNTEDADNNYVENLYSYRGNLKFSKYFDQIKANINNMKEDSLVASQMSTMLKDTTVLNQFVKNPLGSLMGLGLTHVLKPAIGQITKSLDESLSSIMPAITARINTFEDSNSQILKYIYKTFGSKVKYDRTVHLDKFHQGEMPWNGLANKALTEIIPTYLRRIESAVTGAPERVFDTNTGKFTSVEKISKNYDEKLAEYETSGYREFTNNFNAIMDNMDISYELSQQMEKDLNEYYRAITKKGSIINPFISKDLDGNDVDELSDRFNWDKDRKRLFRAIMGQMDKKQLSQLASNMIFDSRVASNQFMDEIRRDPTKYMYSTLYNESTFDEMGKLQYDYSKSPLLKGSGDTEGILSNIMLMLARGIVVYPQFDKSNPNTDMFRKHNDIVDNRKKAEDEYKKRIRILEGEDYYKVYYGDQFNTNNDEEDPFEWMEDLDDDELSEKIKEAADKARDKKNAKEFKQNRFSRKVTDKLGRFGDIVNRTTNTVDNAVYKILFGGGINEDTTDEELMQYVQDKVEDFRNEDHFSGILGTVQDTYRGVLSYFTGRAYRGSRGQIIKTEGGLIDKIKSGFNKIFGKDEENNQNDRDKKSVFQTISENFMDGFKQFKIMIFGRKGVSEEDMRETMGSITNKIKERMPKAIGKGALITTVKTAVVAKAGLLGSILLPGGPIAGMLTATTYSFLRQSETFNKWLFGEKDQEGKRMGGFIPKSIQDMVNQHSKGLKIGGAVGAGVGMLPFFFLPGGPITGSLLGAGMGIVSKTDKFQQWMFGDNFDDKDNRSIMNGKFMKFFKDRLPSTGAKVDKRLATFLGGSGVIAGVAQGVGLLPSFLLPGGPIVGAMFGLAGGILASTDKFQQWLFGDKEADGRRYGGILTQFTNWFQTTVMTPFKIQAGEIKDRMLYFVEDKVVEPFRKMFAPLTQAFRFIVDDAKQKMSEVWTNLTDGIVGAFNDNVVKPFGEKLEKYVVNPLKKLFSTALSMVGKVLGTMVSLPIKIATGAVGGLANKFNKRHVRKSKMKENREQYGFIRGTLKSWKDRRQDYKDNIFYMSDEYKEKEKERKRKKQEEREARKQEREDMWKQYEEDRQYGKQHNWKWGSKKQREKHEQEVKERQQWMAEQNTLKTEQIAKDTKDTKESISKIEDIIQNLPDFDKDKKQQLENLKKSLVDKLDELIKQGKELGMEEQQTKKRRAYPRPKQQNTDSSNQENPENWKNNENQPTKKRKKYPRKSMREIVAEEEAEKMLQEQATRSERLINRLEDAVSDPLARVRRRIRDIEENTDENNKPRRLRDIVRENDDYVSDPNVRANRRELPADKPLPRRLLYLLDSKYNAPVVEDAPNILDVIKNNDRIRKTLSQKDNELPDINKLSSKERTQLLFDTLKNKDKTGEAWLKDNYKKQLQEMAKKQGHSHAEGLDEVPEDDYAAELHKGEMVVPKEGADDLREMSDELDDTDNDEKSSKSKKGKKKHSIVDKLFGSKDGKKQGFFGRMMSKFRKDDARDRADNRHGMTELEEQQAKAQLDDERREFVSRKNVDWLQDKWDEEKKQEEETKYKAQILKAIQNIGKQDKKKQSWWEKLFGGKGLLGSFFGGGLLSGALKLIGILGIGALIAKLLGFLGDGSSLKDIITNSFSSLKNFLDTGNNENRLNEDDEYVTGGTSTKAGQIALNKGAKLVTKKGEKVVRGAIKTKNAVKKGGSKIKSWIKPSEKAAEDAIKQTTEKTTKQTTEKVTKDTAKKSARDITKNGVKVNGEKIEKSAVEKTFEKTLKQGAKEGTEEAVASKGFMTKFITKVKSAVGKFTEFFAKKFPKSSINTTKATEKATKILTENTDSIIKRFGKRIGQEIGEDIAKTVPVIGQVITAGMTLYDFTTGFTKDNAANLFQVSGDAVDGTMRTISSGIQAITNFWYFGVIWLVNDITKVVADFSFLRELCINVYNSVKKNDKFESNMTESQKRSIMTYEEAVKAAGANWEDYKGKDPSKVDHKKLGVSDVDQYQIERAYYNEQHGTKLNNAAYSDTVNPLFGKKVANFFHAGEVKKDKDFKQGKTVSETEGSGLTGGLDEIRNQNRKKNGNENALKDKEREHGFIDKMFNFFGMTNVKKKDETKKEDSKTKTTGGKEDSKTKTTTQKNNESTIDPNSRAGMGAGDDDLPGLEQQINPDSKVKPEKTSEGSGHSIFNTLKTFISPRQAKYKVQSDTAVKPEMNPEDIKKQNEDANIKMPNAIETLFGKVGITTTKLNKEEQATDLLNINEKSTETMSDDMTKSQLLISKSFTKQQKTLADTYKASSRKLDKNRKSMTKELDAQLKKFEESTKKTFTMFNSKMSSMMGIMNNANVNTSQGSVVSNPVTDLVDDILEDNDKEAKDAADNNESGSTKSGNGNSDGIGEIRQENIKKHQEEEKDKKDKEKKKKAGTSGMTEQDKTFLRKLNYERFAPSKSDYLNAPPTTNNNTTTNNINKSNTKMVFYSQNDGRWSTKMLGNKTMADAGCGPTSVAMAISQLTGKMVTPEIIATLGRDELPGYSTFSLFPEIADKLNMNYSEATSNYGSFIKDKLSKGIPVVVSGKATTTNSPYTRDGHVVTLSRMDGDRVFVQDPKGKMFSRYYKIQDVLPGISKTMAYGLSNRMQLSDIPASGDMSDIDTSIYKSTMRDKLGTYDVSMFANDNAGLAGDENASKNNSVSWGYFCDPSKGGITALFGQKRSAYANARGEHGALDYNVHYQPLYAPKSGTVVGENGHWSYGNALVIKTNDGDMYYRMAHMSKKDVKKGDTVKMGQKLGTSGNTGHSTGPHVHFEVLKGGTSKGSNGVDPLNYYDTYKSSGVDRVKIKGGMSYADYMKNLGNIAEANAAGSDSTSTDGTTDGTATTPTESVELMGMFGKMNKVTQNYIASVFNGKEVDLFGVTGTPENSEATGVTGNGEFPKYNLTDQQIKGLAHIVEGEQPGIEGHYAEASLMANLNDISGNEKATTENLIHRATSGWFANGAYRYKHPGNPVKTAIQAVKDVIVGGKRTLPRYVNEHDCFSDLTSVTTNGKSVKKSDRSAYKQFVTKIKNRYGASGTFYTFPNSKSDPFYYTSEEYRKKWGENHYSINGGTGFGDNDKFTDASDNLSYYNQYFLNKDEDPTELGESIPADQIITDDDPRKNKKSEDEEFLIGGAGDSNKSSGSVNSMNGYAYYSQADPQWNKQKIGRFDIANYGCGPTSAAMMLTTMFGKQINPFTVAKWAYGKNAWGAGGMGWNMPSLIASNFGLNLTKNFTGKSDSSFNTLRSELKAGHPVMLSGKAPDRAENTPFTPKGHIVLAVGTNGNNIVINDPRSSKRAKAYTQDQMKRGTGMRLGWAFAKTSKAKIPSGIQVDGDFVPGQNITTVDGTTDETATTPTESIELMGMFSKLNKVSQNYIASVFNGKEVDLFGTTNTTPSVTNTTSSGGSISSSEWDNTMFMGDSIMVPMSSAGKIPKERVAAVGGDTALKGFKQVDKIVKRKPPLVIMNYGTNDSAYFIDMKKYRNKWFKEKYIELINKVKAGSPNTKVALNQVFESTAKIYKDTIPEVQPIVSEVASQTGSILVDVRDINKQGKDYHTADGVHFTSAFYPVWLNALKSKLVGGSGTGYGDLSNIPYLTDDQDLGEQLMGDDEYAGKADDTSTTNNDSGSSEFPASANNFAYFSQYDPRWNNETIDGVKVIKAGCGPTSHAMMLTNAFGKVINPLTMTKWAFKHNGWDSGGMKWNLPDVVASEFGFKIPYTQEGHANETLSKLKEEIKAGRPVVMSGTASAKSDDNPFTPNGHIVLGVGVDGSGNMIINDPRDILHSKAYPDSVLQKGVGLKKAWSFEKTENAKIPEDVTVDGDYTATGGTTNTNTTQTESIDLLGVFSKMNKVIQNYVASIFNGKEVDLFGTTTTTTSDGSNPDVSNISDNRKAVWTYFTGKGYTNEATAGIMGNMHTESGGTYDPSIIQGNGKGPAAGICQWENYNTKSARWKELSDYASSKGKNWDDLQSQLEFIDMELAGKSKDTYTNTLLKKKVGGYDGYKKLTDIETAVKAFESSFERAGVKAYDKRVKYGKENYDLFAGGSAGNGDGRAGTGGGDGNTYLINPAGGSTKIRNTNSSSRAGMGAGDSTLPSIKHKQEKLSTTKEIRAGLGAGLEKLKQLAKNSELKNNSIQLHNTVIEASKNSQLSDAMVESLIEMLTELKEINKNTAETAQNVSKIQVYSENEPISNHTKKGANGTKKITAPNNQRVGITNDSNYKTARSIASFTTL